MRVAGLIQDSIVDGPGFRFVVFLQGCKLQCEGCHNPDAWDMDGGIEMTVDEIVAQMLSNPLTDGLTLSGGEPFLQAHECISLAIAARDNNLNVWIYTGFTIEELMGLAENDEEIRRLLELTHVVIDGKFILKERTLSLRWRGSKNQRIIDVQKSLRAQEAVEFGY